MGGASSATMRAIVAITSFVLFRTPDQTVLVSVKWSDPLGGSTNDYDLYIWGWGPDPDPDFILSTFTANQCGGWSDTCYSNPAYDQLPDSDFVLGTAAVDPSDRFLYDPTSGRMWYDADGSGAGLRVQVLALIPLTEIVAADIVFVGGSLVPVGGHNLLEPAALGKPIITGPVLFNFTDISELLKDANALTIIHDAESLAEAVLSFFSDSAFCRQQGKLAAGHAPVEGSPRHCAGSSRLGRERTQGRRRLFAY